jgi:hypothetical protein
VVKSLCPKGAALESKWLQEPIAVGATSQISKEWPAFSAHLATCTVCSSRMIGK